jgi:HD superfamily phosphohydrolase YqeK
MTGDTLLDRYAAGQLPEWAELTPKRLEHVARVAALMDGWAADLGLSGHDRARWRASGWLHDALRDAPADHLRPWTPPPFDALPDSFQHGPAAAARLERDGFDDGEVLEAIRFHTLGHPGLATLGLSLMAADFLEPGRRQDVERRAMLRARMPHELSDVMLEIVDWKTGRTRKAGLDPRPEMLALRERLARDGTERSG